MKPHEFYDLYLQANAVVIDSRKIGPNDIFIAFSGDNFDAATKAQDAIAAGALAVMVENEAYQDEAKNIFYTPSCLQFLQDLAKHHRQQLHIPIIGLTGSNGKTTTKELIHAVLQRKYHTQYTHGNLNNHIGVPLTLLSIKPEHQMAVVEMGANHQKEIEFLCQLAQPNLGYITNFGKAHLEGFGGVEGVIKGKSELYDYLKSHQQTVLINLNDPIQVEKTQNYLPLLSFDVKDYQSFIHDNKIGLRLGNLEIQTQLTGDYNLSNIAAAIAFGLKFGVDLADIKAALEAYTPQNMRSQIVQKNNKTLVLDTYNANPSSMAVALQNFAQYQGSKSIILGEMRELGEASIQEHQAILDLAQSLNFDQMILVGEKFQALNSPELCFENVSQLGDYLKVYPIKTQNILIKGSRGIALESVLDLI
jgi:UDP-N-acetylmuramoyl-tripeptide--D-alanyl-D-alanine ligase